MAGKCPNKKLRFPKTKKLTLTTTGWVVKGLVRSSSHGEPTGDIGRILGVYWDRDSGK